MSVTDRLYEVQANKHKYDLLNENSVGMGLPTDRSNNNDDIVAGVRSLNIRKGSVPMNKTYQNGFGIEPKFPAIEPRIKS
jgi:hypothetical protein